MRLAFRVVVLWLAGACAWPLPLVSAQGAGPAPEAIGLDGRAFYPPELSVDARRRLDGNLAEAVADFIRDPDAADSIIWLGRRLAYLSRYREAIDVYSRGIAKFPGDPRMYRHRGHRYITTRQFGRAAADLERAAALVKDRPVEGEPDGAPGRRPSPSSSLHFNVYYHLGLAYYLQGRFEEALAAYRACLRFSTDNDDSLVATSDWLYMTLRRLGRRDEAATILAPIREGLDVLDNGAYYQRLLMYKGLRTPDAVMPPGETDPTQIATQGYGVANFRLVNGDVEGARVLLRRVVAGTQWAAFGFIAAEADLARLK
jgi:tetratricopeptide (TPR) repeat protein